MLFERVKVEAGGPHEPQARGSEPCHHHRVTGNHLEGDQWKRLEEDVP